MPLEAAKKRANRVGEAQRPGRGENRGGGSPQSSRYIFAGKRGVIVNYTRRIICPLWNTEQINHFGRVYHGPRTDYCDRYRSISPCPQTERMLGPGWVCAAASAVSRSSAILGAMHLEPPNKENRRPAQGLPRATAIPFRLASAP